MVKISKNHLALGAILVVAAILRLFKLNEVPVSLFGDELDVGYHAYSILKTGRDYSGNLLPFHFQSLAEWRTPLYLYSVVPTVFLFGVSPLGVRLPAAIFGILGVLAFYFLTKLIREKYLGVKNESLELFAAFVLAISPWHIQYSRGAFEVTEMLLFLILGFYFFLKGLENGKYLHLAVTLFALTPWIYSTAKLFIPIIVAALGLVYFKDLVKISKKNLIGSAVLFVVISLPVIYSIFLGSGSQRYEYIGVFSDESIEHQVGLARDVDNSLSAFGSRVFHNKYVVWTGTITNNFLAAYSTDFLFINGDTNPRHSVENIGMFYKIEIVALLLGIVAFFSVNKNNKIKLFLIIWLIAGVIPSALTSDGGNHATRLILILPPVCLLIALGIFRISKSKVVFGSYFFVLLVLFVHYQHQYWVHNTVSSEKWWHAGWEEAVFELKANEENYEKIVISTANEPPWIFFAGWYEYDPKKWHDISPLDNKVLLDGFGEVSHIGKYYFGSPEEKDVYNFGKVIDSETLYLASATEIGPDLIAEPERTPADLRLIKAISYPSGAPAFYLFSGK